MQKPSTVFLTPTQAAAILSVSPTTICDYARRRIIPARKIGKHWRFLEAELMQAGEVNFAHLRGPLRLPKGNQPMGRERINQIARTLRQRMNLA